MEKMNVREERFQRREKRADLFSRARKREDPGNEVGDAQ